MMTGVSCDECGRQKRIHRRYRGHAYCVSCYVREFVRKGCPGCGAAARLPCRIPEAICRRCEAARPCVRCGESGKPVGKITDYGTVCASCAPYFRAEEPCDVCGQPSRRLTRVRRLGDDLRRCERCVASDFGTCPECRRYRKLKHVDGRGLCAACHSGESRHCESCGAEVPAGRGKQCEPCYWRILLDKRTRINAFMLTTGDMQNAFAEFASWFGSSSGSKKAALSLSRYIRFFEDIESRWLRIPSYPELLELFGADTLRRYRKAIQWLAESGRIHLDSALRDTVAENQRIWRMLERFPTGARARLVLGDYVAELRQRCATGKIQLKTVRLSLTPAIGLMQASTEPDNDFPVQASVDRYLADHPGQRAALGGFLSFLNNRHQIALKLPDRRETRSRRRANIESRLASLAGRDWNENIEAEWIVYALEYFHAVRGVSHSQARGVVRTTVAAGLTLTLEGRAYFLPLPRSALAMQKDSTEVFGKDTLDGA